MLNLHAIADVLDRYLGRFDIEPVRKDEPTEPEWRLIHRIMDRAEPKLRRGFLDAVARLQGEDTRRAVESALRGGKIEAAVKAIPWGDFASEILSGKFMAEYAEVFQQAGTVSARMIQDVTPAEFTITDPLRVQFLERHGAELVTELTETGQQAVRGALVQIERQGLSTEAAGRLIAEHVGLTERLSTAVQNFVSGRITQGQSEAKAVKAGELYARRLLVYRTNNIARTEAQFAASSGQAAAWQQAVLDERVDPDVAVQVWLTARDEATCEICEPMDGQEVRLGEPFETGAGDMVDGPPAHPSCRCSRLLAAEGSRRLKSIRLVKRAGRMLYELTHEWWREAA